ncbi:MAG: beta-propeller fold lactonase family protein [Saprospiraceae bacterium]|nr:beta-propeller fold lactonase family protein [Candidatus Defluviibacterium haderslevense]
MDQSSTGNQGSLFFSYLKTQFKPTIKLIPALLVLVISNFELIGQTPTVDKPLDQILCAGSNTTPVTFTGTVPGTIYNWTCDNTAIGLAASGTGDIPSFNASNNTNLAITANITVTPVMPATNGFAYIPNAGSDDVSVINTISNTVVSTILVGDAPAGVSVSADGTRAYISNYLSDNVSVINTLTNTVVATITVGDGPRGVSISPDGTRLYVTNFSSSNVSVINTGTNIIDATIPIVGGPEGVSVSPDGTKAYITSFNSVSVINTGTNTVVATIPVGVYPQGVSVSPDGTLVYVTSSGANNVSVINTGTNIVVATIPVGLFPVGVTVSPDGTKAYIANFASDNITVINTSTNTVVTTIIVGSGPRGVSISPDGTNVYITNYYSNNLSVINTITNAVLTTIQVGTNPGGSNGNFITGNPELIGTPQTFTITVNPIPTVDDPTDQTVCAGDNTAAVQFTGTIPGTMCDWTCDNPAIGLAGSGTGDISSFTATNNTNAPITATITVTPTQPVTNGFAYIPNLNSDNVSVINTLTNTIIATITVGDGPYGVSVKPDGTSIYVTNFLSNNVSIINASTNSVVTTIAVGINPGGVSISPDGLKAYITNINSDNVSVINTVTNTVVATIPVGIGPFGVSISPDGSKAYITNINSDNVSVINTVTNTVVATIPVGNLPQGLSVSPDGTKAYIVNAASDNISIINTITNSVVATIPVGINPVGVSISPDGTIAFITNLISNNVSVLNTVTNTIVATIPVGFNPVGVSVSPDGLRVYVTNQGSNDVSVINTITYSVFATIPVGNTPASLGNFITGNPSCTGLTEPFVITVNPIPSIDDPNDQVLCKNGITNPINFSGTVNGTIYNWTNNNTTIGLQASGSGDIPPFMALNGGSTPITATITITPSFTNGGIICYGNSESFTITVNPCYLACDDHINVSLDSNCMATITPEMVLEGNYAVNCLVVVLKDKYGRVISTSPILSGQYIGQLINYELIDTCTRNKCWGTLVVEDKLPPIIVCPDPIRVYCNQTNYVIPAPIVYDSCSVVTRHVVADITEKYPCDSLFAGKRTISYYYTDASGNHSDTCDQCVYFLKVDPNDALNFIWPRDTIFRQLEFSQICVDSIPGPHITGVPRNAGEILYPSWGLCKVALTYEDQFIPVCPYTFKVLRKWTYIDWCRPSGQNIFIHYQVIKFLDERGPVIACAPNITISTDVWTCTGTAIIAPPTIIKECSKVTISVGYKIVSPNGSQTFEGTSSANVTKLSNGLYRITGLPLGTSWVVFHVVDECGNFTDCATEVTVKDLVPPIAVCDQKTVVTLTIDGTAKVEAFTFDDRSHDNCAIDYFEVKRMDDGVPCDSTFKNTINSRQWGPYVYFCCDDIGKTIMVGMRVWDVAGNSNTCMVEVVVQDKIAPFIFCPPNITVSCEFDFPDLSVFGTVRSNAADRKKINIVDKYFNHDGPKGDALDGYAYDGCGVSVTETSTYDLKCGRGYIYRRFEARDPGGLISFCTQKITIQDFTPYNITIKWPRDTVNNTTCISKPFLTPDLMGKPVVYGKDKCSNIFVNSSDQEFTLDPDACLKIIRTWTVIDWCVYEPNNPLTEGYWTWKQIIKISNTVPPVFSSNCKDITIDIFGPGCQGNIPLIGLANDDCTDSAELVWYHEVDLYNDGRRDSSYYGLGANATGAYPVGRHKVTFKVKDACNNESICTYFLTVRDGKKPTPYCNSSITTTVMPSSKSIEIWAKDFNINSEDNCTPKDSLKYYFLVNGHFEPAILFDCSSIGKNILRIYVVDQAGNSDYCEATIEIQDPNNVCPTGITIGGKIVSMNNKGVKDANVSWERQNPSRTNSLYTDHEGNFSFLNLTSGMNYTIAAERNIEYLKGVSTIDIVLIQRHILGIQNFNSPFKYLAGDVNASCSITAADISEIRKLILGKINAFAKSPSWKFIPVKSVLPSASPCGFEQIINYNLINRNQFNTDFYGVKMGDINFDFDADGLQNIGNRSGNNMEMYFHDDYLLPKIEQRIPVYINEEMALEGMQFALNFDLESFQSIRLESAQLQIDQDQYSISSNRLLVSIAETNVIKLDPSKPLFTLIVNSSKQLRISEFMHLDENVLNAECYDSELNIHPISFAVRNSNEKPVELKSVLYQNKPNPFNESTLISFVIPKKQEVEFIFYEMNGKVIHKFIKSFDKGYHEFELKKSEINTAGVLFMQMNTEDFTDTKRLVLIR